MSLEIHKRWNEMAIESPLWREGARLDTAVLAHLGDSMVGVCSSSLANVPGWRTFGSRWPAIDMPGAQGNEVGHGRVGGVVQSSISRWRLRCHAVGPVVNAE